MLFKKLIFDNYKTYYGHQEVDFYIPKEVREEGEKNIILLGGLNGAGKTTILKAILYVLFGKRGFSPAEHKRVFSNVINNTFFDEGGRDCSVTLAIETDKNEEWTLKVKWGFDHNKRLISENRDLTVKKPGAMIGKTVRIDNIDTFNRFMDKMIPYHAAPFFIFDGEEIKDIILRQNSEEMKEAIHKITGMETYKLLLSDLSSIKTGIEKNLAKAVDQNKLKSLDANLKEYEEQIQHLEKRKELISSERKKFDDLINEVKNERNEKITTNSKSREVIVKKQSGLATELRLAKEQFENYFNNNAINIILKEKTKLLQNRLKLEYDIRQKKMIQDASLMPYEKFMDELLNQPFTPPLSNEQLNQLKEIGREIWVKENNIEKDISEDHVDIHDISNKDYNYLVNLPARNNSYVIDLINKIEKLNLELDALEIEIRNAPETIDISAENERIDLLTKKLGELNLKYKSIIAKLNKIKEQRTTVVNQLTRLSDQGADYDALNKRLIYVKKLIHTMNAYVHEMTKLKASFIREEFSSMLSRLFRKQDEFGKIEFDISTYTVRLYNDRNQEISIQDRSAGEMQMISSSLIWALTKASDLALPMVIDTPLGRLDSYHRNHLINHYYKELSEQVIILSTDTEITQDYINFMQEHSYKQYMLDYDQSKKYTVIRDGYFDFIKV
ncbi:DNA sulfur modification protein DndD [Bacillus thuringiensis]|uniref:Nuclease SbcCD subunit C n=1 Tax=Bacillus thuringiensis subsp. finitimus TaxID=29337 RepID=A0A243G9V8_BACTF|nr:DNA sulfur modification protein DndD [Bacillus thuringiensis]ALQ66674.1 DNA sulfur modification protein DndD [Bacillus thuringiensis]MDA1870420.1 DNA sulfur modification protein DndD [Bacillus cereus]OUA03838.1 DNA sulfur modification protein DndD [Bacillus thuringiensis serovar finitimus]